MGPYANLGVNDLSSPNNFKNDKYKNCTIKKSYVIN